jgi:peptidoglycan/xylan/chitin deacetylase (PgdA/CDA1 family)
MYHRVAEESHDPWDLCVTPDNFAQQMSVLRSAGRPTDLAALAAERGAGGSGRPRLAVTFDDGYLDNALSALPVLERYDIPATIFVVSGKLGSAREFWWDALERCVLRPPALPASLELAAGGTVRRWSVPAGAPDPADAGWRADLEVPATPRQALFLELWEMLVLLDPAERDEALDGLIAWASVDPAPPGRLAMGVDDLVRIAEHPLIEIGAHTAAHPSLPHQPAAVQRREIEEGLRSLEAMIGKPIRRFAYPYGRYDEVAAAIVRERFDVACTSRPAAVTPVAGALALPRMQAVDGDGEAFTERVRTWLPAFAT